MKQNDMRGVVYLIISLIALYYLLDNFFGKSKINSFVAAFIGNFGGPPAATDTSTQASGAADPATAPAGAAAAAKVPTVDPKNVKIPQAEPDPGKIKIPQPEGNQTWPAKPKSGGAGLGLNDVFGLFNPFPLGIPLAGAAAAAAAGVMMLPQTIGKEMGAAF